MGKYSVYVQTDEDLGTGTLVDEVFAECEEDAIKQVREKYPFLSDREFLVDFDKSIR